MNRIIILSVIIVLLILVGVATLNRFLIVLSLPFFLYLLTGLYHPDYYKNLVINREFSTKRVSPGVRVTISVSIENHGPRLDSLLVEDRLPAGIDVVDGSPSKILSLKSGDSFTWKYEISGQRGFYPFDYIDVETRSMLGLSSHRKRIPMTGNLIILPRVLNLRRVAIRPYWTRVYSGDIPSRSGGQGTDFFGIRDYQPGDPPNWINWHASARHPSGLFSNEFEQDRVSDVGIILDGREITNRISSTASIFEYSVMAAATLAAAFLQQGDRVSLLNYGKYLEWTFPGYGKYQLERILRALSKAQAGRSLVFSYLEYIPTQIFPPKSQIVLISPLGSDDPQVLLQIRARGYQVLVISPDPISFEASTIPLTKNYQLAAKILDFERRTQINKLLRGGIRVLDWNINQPFEQIVLSLQSTPAIFHNATIQQ